MQLSDLRTAVRSRAGIDPADGMLIDSVLNSFINGAVRQVAIMQDWDWNFASETITSVIDQDSYDRAARATKTDMVVDILDGGLLQQTSRAMAVRFQDRGSIPRFWYVLAGKLHLSPTPKTVRTYRHVYVTSEAPLSANDDEPSIPDYAIDLVIVKAALMATARTDNTSQQRLLAEEEKDLIDALDDEARRSRGSATIHSRRDWYV